jgi:hypothetical protein
MSEIPIELVRLITIAIAFGRAWMVHGLAPRMAARLVTLDRFAGHNQKLRAERRRTLRGLPANAISLLAFVIASLFALSRYSPVSVWLKIRAVELSHALEVLPAPASAGLRAGMPDGRRYQPARLGLIRHQLLLSDH